MLLLLPLLSGCGVARPNLLLVVVDTLRADALDSGSGQRNVTPRLDALAREGVRFAQARSPAPWTMPAIASLLTGWYPRRHGVMGGPRALSGAARTLAERLAEAGWRTGAVTSHLLVAPQYGFQQGFERFVVRSGGHRAVTGAAVSEAAIAMLDELGPGEPPFFLFVHYFDPHYAWVDHPDLQIAGPRPAGLRAGTDYRALLARREALGPDEVAYLRALYDEEVRSTDAQIGGVLDALDARGLSAHTWVVVTSDHGEEFLEHGWLGHTASLHDTLLRVPLILRPPGGGAPRRVEEPVSLAGLAPTLLALLGVPAAPEDFDVASFAPLVRGESLAVAPLRAEVDYRAHPEMRTAQQMVLEPPYKLIEDRGRGATRLYDVHADPGERRDLAASRPDVVARLRRLLPRGPAAVGDAEAPALDAEERTRLRELGYVE